MPPRHRKVFDFPWCIYCGGDTKATTVDHVPPISMFDGRDRPKGLEFPSCAECNAGTRIADLVAALIGRVYPDGETQVQKDELVVLLKGVSKNVPGLLEEMEVPRAKARFSAQRYGTPNDGGFLKLGGPIASKYLALFAAKLAFAFHFEKLRQPVPATGGVVARVYSNLEASEGVIPNDIFEFLNQPQTLTQGVKNVEGQFRYEIKPAVEDQMTMGFASFRRSFAVVTFSSTSEEKLRAGSDVPRIFRPGSLKAISKPDDFFSLKFEFKSK